MPRAAAWGSLAVAGTQDSPRRQAGACAVGGALSAAGAEAGGAPLPADL